ncbi:MAG TPA: alpha amylase C-terminal domain-containing protein, partial [Saccharofermentans sp.]|nr:alpha amylase C-terminal domain-containing protein [Saccharofermentans sp.]
LDYKIPVYDLGKYSIIVNTDSMIYGGSGYPSLPNGETYIEAIDEPYNGKPYHLKINIPPLAGMFLMLTKVEGIEAKEEKSQVRKIKPIKKTIDSKKKKAKKTNLGGSRNDKG